MSRMLLLGFYKSHWLNGVAMVGALDPGCALLNWDAAMSDSHENKAPIKACQKHENSIYTTHRTLSKAGLV